MIICGDSLTVLRPLPDESVNCCVTSPPYWGLRDYGTAKWEGGEGCDHMAPPTGGKTGSTLKGSNQRGTWSADGQYRNTCPKCGARRIDSQLGLEKTPEEYVARMVEVFREVRRVLRKDGTCWLNLGDSYNTNQGGNWGRQHREGRQYTEQAVAPYCGYKTDTLKPKDLCGIPWRVAFALQADGWVLRQEIIWQKPNPMP